MRAELRLSGLLAAAGVEAVSVAGPDPRISAVRVDSRAVLHGDLFCAIRGFETDGERFVGDAVGRGAVAVLAESPRPDSLAPGTAWVCVRDARRAAGPLSRVACGRPDDHLTLVGVTGTNGKTTVTWMIESIARAAGRSAGRLGTTGTAFAGRDLPAARTTPEAPELFALLAEMVDAGVDLVAMEVSSHALALGRVGGARFAVAAFLNLSRDHLDFHESLESYFEAKAALFDSLRSSGVAVLPADDPFGPRIAARTAARILTFGRGATADVRIVDESTGREGGRAVLRTAGAEIAIRTPLVGRFNLDNAAAAAACTLAAGLPHDAVIAGLAALDRVPGRVERIDRGQPFEVWVDYAHTPVALDVLLRAARDASSGAVAVVFGCGGDRDRGKRSEMGRCAAVLADRTYLTSDNPRSEDPLAILREIETGFRGVVGPRGRCAVEPDRASAIAAAIAEARPGDVVVIAGKGHETGQAAGTRVHPFDDRLAAAEALEAAGRAGSFRARA